ncbi:DUF3251 domain-containing protein, partial [Escherichia coli]
DRNRSHWSTSKTPSYTKSVSWQHHLQGESNDPLPAFSGTVEYGQIQGTIDNFQEINVQNQLINAPASVLAPSDVDIPLQLKGISVDQLGFVRIHDIQPVMH